MSSAVYVRFDEAEGVSRKEWDEFREVYGITYHPETVGRNVFYSSQVEMTFGEPNYEPLPTLGPENPRLDFSSARPPDYAERVTFSTFFLGPDLPRVAELARAFWIKYGGCVQCDQELRLLFASTPGTL